MSSGGGIDISATGADVTAGDDIDITATLSSVIITSTEEVADALRLNASAGGIDIDGTNSTINITNTADGAEDDIKIHQAGAFDASMILRSEGTGTDAIKLNATAGGVEINAGTGLNVDAATALDITNTCLLYTSDAADDS